MYKSLVPTYRNFSDLTKISNFLKLKFLSSVMDVNEYNKILHYKKLSATSSKLLTRKERHLWTKLCLFLIQDGKLCKNGKQILQSEDAYPTLVKVPQDKSHPNHMQLGRLAHVKYHVERLRPICQRIVTQCEKCQQRIEVLMTGPMVHNNRLRVARICKQLLIPMDGTKSLSRAFQM